MIPSQIFPRSVKKLIVVLVLRDKSKSFVHGDKRKKFQKLIAGPPEKKPYYYRENGILRNKNHLQLIYLNGLQVRTFEKKNVLVFFFASTPPYLNTVGEFTQTFFGK